MKVEGFFRILQGAPWWVYIALAYVVYIGFRSSRARVMPVFTAFPIPFLAMTWSLFRVYSLRALGAEFIVAFVVSVVAGMILGYNFLYEKPTAIDKKQHLMFMPGTYVVLILLLCVFSIKFYFGYLNAVDPVYANSLASVQVCMIAGISGIFAGRLARIVNLFLG